VSCQLEVRSKHSSNDPAAAASPMSASQRSVTNRNRKVYESRVPTWKREDRENLNLQRASLVLIDLLERADDGLPLLVRALCFYPCQPAIPASHLRSSCYLRCCKIHSASWK
jgi:hypothetical protein